MKSNEKIIYPIGIFKAKEKYSIQDVQSYIEEIVILPVLLREAVSFDDPSLAYQSYKEGGWNVNQIVSHVADSHMNAFVRFKLALTEDNPQIKPYNQDRWAETADALHYELMPSLSIIDGVHKRWACLLKSMKSEQFARIFYHPEQKRAIRLDELLHLYSWHGRHHVGQIRIALNSRNPFS